ncbi:hypothetical protein M5X11_26745 [Paenibacillus alginolyticus]|uniref:hypothetical protein n=1 Tax=Paenibacillus alginolyticus TaxID=59839 RepID=UPI000FDB3BA3|nr:hypothetical protein [Paenibacillus alginolyticus]MCY9668482.1 hypothetical protein [Paenibacillus alginolyticus]
MLMSLTLINKKCSRRVTVQVFDWSTGSAIPLKVSPCNRKNCTVTVAPHKSVFLFADVSKVKFKYEVLITQLHDRKLVTNVTGVTNAPFTPQEGDTVLQRSLIKIK